MEEKLIERLERAVTRLESLSAAGGVGSRDFTPDDAVDLESDPAIMAFSDLMATSLARVSSAAENIGDKVLEATKILEAAFAALKELLIKVKQSQKPDMQGLVEFLKPLNEVICKGVALTEGRRSDFFNHQKTIAESLSALAWIAYTGKDCGMSLPIAHVEDCWQMAEFYNNKVLVEYRSKDPNHVEWAKAVKELYMPGLRDYVKSFYPLGPVWGTAGKAVISAPSKPSAPAAPPLPPSSLFTADSSKPSSSAPKIGMSAVFQEINSGGVTSGLKKVTADMKTKNHTNRSGVVSAGGKEPRKTTAAFSKTGPPKLELQMGRKWVVENHIGKKDLVISECDSKQSVYVYGCKDSVLQIQGKVNNITLDKCSKMGIDVVAACEIVNCNSVEVQSQGSAPTISVDNTSGCQLYLSKESLGASITTAKSSEINVLVSSEEGDWGEHSLPQQFVHEYINYHILPATSRLIVPSAMAVRSLTILFTLLCLSFYSSEAQSFIGVNYGEVADNLPPATETAKLLQSTSISKVRMYGADPAMLKALANTGISIVIGAANGDIPALATDPSQATQWINSNVLPYYPASNIILITVGNEVMSTGDQNLISQLLPAMRNVENALKSASLGGKIKVSTVHSMAVLSQSDPPSSGAFNPALGATMKALLEFLKGNGSPFTINPYPFFAYQSDRRPETLAFCLFQPNAGRVDSNTNIKYLNMFDAQIVVAETGWPYNGDANEAGATIDNAKAYNGGLISHLRSMVGTPLMPGKSVDTYIFALYDEDLKPGPTSERSFGLFKPKHAMTYDVGLSKSSQAKTPSAAPSNSTPTATTQGWCVPKQGISDAQLQPALDYACGQQGVDCGPIQPGGACFDPNTVASHAAYAMNSYYQASSKQPSDCDFSQTATLTSVNPSYNSCVYRRGGGGGNSLASARMKLANKAEKAGDIRGRVWWWYCSILVKINQQREN
ncbi:hypothetical protein V2J09_009674 [Rumex salicifolius]